MVPFNWIIRSMLDHMWLYFGTASVGTDFHYDVRGELHNVYCANHTV